MAEFLSPSSNQAVSLHHSHSQRQRPTEDDDDDNSATDKKHQPKFQQVIVGTRASSSSSSGRKPRGRPLGSKNKPKPPVVITKESESAMHQLFLEISPSTDILDAVSDFARRRGASVSVIAGSGPVSNVSLRHPTLHSSAITLPGRFEILSLAGTFLPPPAAAKSASPFTVSLVGAQGQVIGGMVVGPLVAAGTVMLTAASFVSPEFYRLPMSRGDQEEQQPAAASRDEDVKDEIVYTSAGPTSAVTQQLQQAHHEMVLWRSPTVSPRAPPPHTHRQPPPQY